MTDLVITRGIPGCGKTTWAREWVTQGEINTRARVNRDDLRMNMFGRPAPLPFMLEKAVTAAQQEAVRGLLRTGYSVVVDDTHIRSKYVKAWAEIASDEGADFWVNLMIEVSLEECIRRDLARERTVGAEVIKKMHSQLFSSLRSEEESVPTQRYVYDPDSYSSGSAAHLRSAYLVDIDGTLAEMNGRSPYDLTRVSEDLPVRAVVQLINQLSRHAAIVVMSGREDACRADTAAWLIKHSIHCDALFMRETGDQRDDAIVKLELFRLHVAPSWRVLGVFDDRNKVVKMWRRIGLLCCQVAPGAF